jgi:hypothetical protein
MGGKWLLGSLMRPQQLYEPYFLLPTSQPIQKNPSIESIQCLFTLNPECVKPLLVFIVLQRRSLAERLLGYSRKV